MKRERSIETKIRRMGVSRNPKAGGAAAVCIAALVGLAACASRPAVDSWGDAGLAAEQRLIIEQQQQRFDDMERIVGEVQSGLGRAIDEVTASLDGNGDLKHKFAEIDVFVRAVIESKQKLEALQRTDSGADAGAR